MQTMNKIFAVFDGSRRHRYESFGDICETVQAHYGTGGNNVPLVLEMYDCDIDRHLQSNNTDGSSLHD